MKPAASPAIGSSPKIPQKPSTPFEDPDEGGPSIYQTLLSLYLNPPPPNKPNLPPAIDLLSKHGSRLPAASTLSLIPDTLPVSDLELYFRGRIRAANSAVNENRIVAGLRQTELVASQGVLLLGDGIPGGQGGRNRRVIISDERVCGVCHKRLGGSVVAALPDNAVVHYGCLNRNEKANLSSAGAGGIGEPPRRMSTWSSLPADAWSRSGSGGRGQAIRGGFDGPF